MRWDDFTLSSFRCCSMSVIDESTYVTLQVRQRPDSIHGRFRGPVAEALDQYDGILKYISTVAYCSTDLNRNRSFVEYFWYKWCRIAIGRDNFHWNISSQFFSRDSLPNCLWQDWKVWSSEKKKWRLPNWIQQIDYGFCIATQGSRNSLPSLYSGLTFWIAVKD